MRNVLKVSTRAKAMANAQAQKEYRLSTSNHYKNLLYPMYSQNCQNMKEQRYKNPPPNGNHCYGLNVVCSLKNSC
jgi:hypothetical protein